MKRVQSYRRAIKSAVIVIDMVLVQNLFEPFCCVFGKDPFTHFPLLGGLSKLLQIFVKSLKNLKKQNKKFQPDSNTLSAGGDNCLTKLPYI